MRDLSLKFKSVFLATTLFFLACLVSHAAPIDVFILAGQSNAAGRALSAELSSNLDSVGVPYNSYAANSNSVLYANRERDVSDLSIIHDQPFGDLRIKSRILPWKGELGVELSLARDLADASSNPVAFVKYTIGSTNIDRWDGPTDLYPPFVNYLNEMKAELIAAGHTVQWRGAFWVQGESDAYEDRAPLYTTKFNQLFDRLRTDLGANEIPVVMARLKSNLVDEPQYPYSTFNPGTQLINFDMDQVASSDPLVAITDSSNDLLVRDGIHYAADDYIELGHRLAETYLLTQRLDSADFDGNAVVDGTDFLTWQREFGDQFDSNVLANWESNFGQPVDFDYDRDVDGHDFLAWQQDFGTLFDASDLTNWEANFGQPVDYDNDGDVDGHDFLAWQQGFGTLFDASDLANWEEDIGVAPSLAVASVAVPEPSSLLLLLTVYLIGCSRRWQF